MEVVHGDQSRAARRLGPRLSIVVLLALAMLFGVAPFAQPGVRAAAPRVAIIVGPVGALTDSYRADAEKAAAAARRFTDDVVTVYSPDATWKAARAALAGASVVVYLGHGNGWPSRYSRTLNPRTQDGLGLNPVAGVDDVAHQYFGEWHLARSVTLAPNAVVVLSHLCYASGNSEPGLPEGTLDVARQRVDNFAAGFLAAGASAVIADGYLGPAYYVEAILAGKGTVEGIWRAAPTFHDHVIAFPSVRTPGLTALLDPTRPRSQFYRSLVTRADLRAGEVARGAALRADPGTAGASPAALPTPEPRIPPTVESVRLRGIPVAGTSVELVVTFSQPGTDPVASLGLGVRWDPIAVNAPVPTPAAVDAPAPIPADAPAPAPAAVDAPAPIPAATSAPAPTSAAVDAPSPTPAGPLAVPIEAPSVTPLVTPEVLGAVVVLADVTSGKRRLTASIVAPDAPGLYRLVTTVHDPEGAAFPATTQAPVPAVMVRVTRPLSASISAPNHLDLATGSTIELPVAVSNSGAVPWVAPPATVSSDEFDAAPADPKALLVGHWVRLDLATSAPETAAAWAKLDLAPGATERVSLRLTAPDLPGEYLLVLDLMSAIDGSITAAGGEPVVVRVTVSWPVTQFDPTPTPTPGVSDPTRAEQGDGQ